MLPRLMMHLLWFTALMIGPVGAHVALWQPGREARPLSTGDTLLPVVMRFGGDLLPGGSYEAAVDDSADFAFRDFNLFRSADISMVNLESPVTLRGMAVKKPFNFRVKPEFVAALASAGISVVNIANNHIYDFGSEGLFDTILYLDSLKIQHVGAGRNYRDAHRAAVFNIRGNRIGILGYYGGGEAPGATRKNPGVAHRLLADIRNDIDSLRSRDSAEYVVVNFHWGRELADAPDGEQQNLAHQVIDAGANAIIGHHPHVLQGIEWYHGGVIVYSLGNLLFGGNARSTYSTGVFEIRFDGHRAAYRFIPVSVVNWRLSVASGVEAAEIMDHVKELSSAFSHTIFTK